MAWDDFWHLLFIFVFKYNLKRLIMKKEKAIEKTSLLIGISAAIVMLVAQFYNKIDFSLMAALIGFIAACVYSFTKKNSRKNN